MCGGRYTGIAVAATNFNHPTPVLQRCEAEHTRCGLEQRFGDFGVSAQFDLSLLYKEYAIL